MASFTDMHGRSLTTLVTDTPASDPVRPGSGVDADPGRAGQTQEHRLLLSVHMPKTAGTSFSATLRACYGDRYRGDYADLPMQMPRWRRQLRALVKGLHTSNRSETDAVECIHGHFLPAKYASLPPDRAVRFVTWLRNPVERVVSHYHYWRRDYDGSDPAQPLRNRMLAEHWSLERFALGSELRNVYSQYLWHFDVARFDFIGITERYAEDLGEFAERFLGGPVTAQTALANPHRGGSCYAIDSGLREKIEAHHAADMALYRRAYERRLPG